MVQEWCSSYCPLSLSLCLYSCLFVTLSLSLSLPLSLCPSLCLSVRAIIRTLHLALFSQPFGVVMLRLLFIYRHRYTFPLSYALIASQIAWYRHSRTGRRPPGPGAPSRICPPPKDNIRSYTWDGSLRPAAAWGSDRQTPGLRSTPAGAKPKVVCGRLHPDIKTLSGQSNPK